MKLDYLDGKLALFPEKTGPVFIDFTAGKKRHRLQFGGGKGQPLARAILPPKVPHPFVIDATAGMGGDSFVFASLGCQVLMLERCESVAQLLEDALQRGQNDPEVGEIVQRLTLKQADSTDYLIELAQDQNQAKPDVIYLDPMYPEKKKKAAVKKEMQALQQLVGPDLDSHQLLDAALQVATQRVVVKRPAKAAPISHYIVPNNSIKSPNTRYDIYSISALQAIRKR